MSDLVVFSSTTPVAGLPLLVPGQAQKEFFLNQALSILDALYPQAVVSSQGAPPSAIEDGACFRVTSPANQDWAGHEDSIAVRIGDAWHFVAPREGMQVFDRGAGCWIVFRSGWQAATAPVMATSGSVVDVEARTTLAQLISILRNFGILTAPTG